MRRRLPWVLAALSLLAVVSPVAARTSSPSAPAAPAAAAAAAGINTTEAGTGVTVETKFVSSVGWVKPGEAYPFRVIVRNRTPNPIHDVVVTVRPPVGGVLLSDNRPDAALKADGSLVWKLGSLARGSADAPRTRTLVVQARAKSTGADPKVVWRDLSTASMLRYHTGPASGVVSRSHGPKVIPNDARYDTARFGDRPFPVVPVEYTDREATEPAEALDAVINSKKQPGSTFNLYQEMSFGQLFPQGLVPSAGIDSADFTYGPGFDFSELGADANTCSGGVTFGNTPQVIGTPVYGTRIEDGWYQLPGNTAYYGADGNGSALAGAVGGVGALQAIDSGCGPTGKSVYDAANIADPEIDYDDFDTDKDGVVDFFMLIFSGVGGHGASQTSAPPYDNIWPHSSSLEFNYTDAETGLTGYISDDQLTDLAGTPQCWVDDTYSQSADCESAGGAGAAGVHGDDALPVFVRVGPYNVNPESSIDKASVISHEYGHSLGLPDFYSTGSRVTYGDWNLMATDKSQSMDVFSRQELGWVVPREIKSTTYQNMKESDTDIHRIHWKTPKGKPYVLEGPRVHNGPAWMAKLPPRQVIDPKLVKDGASAPHVWWSGSGNDFGCPPFKGHNLDLYVPEMADLAPDTATSLTFNSYFNIEWDYDYGFVLVSTDGGDTWESLASENGYTTPAAQNPNTNPCQQKYGNGITGTGASYDAGTAPADRVAGNYPDPSFVPDQYDLTPYAGEELLLRFTYATDPGLARPGWFMDDIAITAGGTEVWKTDFEGEGDPDDERVFNGGCKEGLGAICTAGWTYVDSSTDSPADHAYYLELRDRSGFDWNGKGENDREAIGFLPGLLLTYTDEAHGYGNVGTDDPPAQSPLDSDPEPGSGAPNLNDAAFTTADGKKSFSDKKADPWVDNYSGSECTADCDNPLLATYDWVFDYNCLTLNVMKMSGFAIDGAHPEHKAPGDLRADVKFARGAGCVGFDYGNGAGEENHAPTAIADAKPRHPKVGDMVTFDASSSYDDHDSIEDLTFGWDFDGDGDRDKRGVTVKVRWRRAVTRDSVLRVKDSGGLRSRDYIRITGQPAN